MADDEGSSLVASQPAERRARRTPMRAPLADERRGWLSHGLAAMAISALGLAVASSVSLTSSAEPAPLTAPVSTTPSRPAAPPSTTSPKSQPASADPSLAAFSRQQRADDATRSDELQAAVVKERAAQRAEGLAQDAEVVTQAARDAGGAARSKDLATSERATREAAVKIAQQRLAAAIRKRVAAEVERQGVETLSATSSTSSTTSATEVGSSSIPSGGGSASPVPGAVIGAGFGQYGSWSRYHTGLDFRAGFGTEIKAVAAGVVSYAGNKGDWAGIHVAVQHAGGVTTMSSHMSSTAVRAGQTVQAGQVIGYVGSTGRSFGAHLHFELYPAGVRYGDVYKAVNPVPWLRGLGVNVN